MKELTDLEICQRIAEIEGIKVRKCGGVICILEATGSSLMKIPTTEYNPLTDDALCFKLMIKHRVICHWLWCENDGTEHYLSCITGEEECSYDKIPNRAICLAIIESKEPKTDA